jgi:Family of unknown function (DUF6150)
MRTKLWIMGAALSLLAATPVSAIKVYKVASAGLADVSVYVTESRGQADCSIYVAPSEGVASGNARWYYESSAGQADVSMYFTDSAGLADKTVFFTTSEGLAKCDVDWRSFKKERILMDKKALTREYKESQRPMGVYQVRNTVNGKLLVGASVDLPSILNRHRADLRMGGHRNHELQNDWNEFGAEAFEFEILDTLTPPELPDYKPKDDLQALEELWLDKLSPFEERGYNVKPKRAT